MIAMDKILEFVEVERKILADKYGGDGYDRIFIGGFSQGSMLTLGLLMRAYEKIPSPLAGFVGMSGCVPTMPSDDY